MTRSFVSERDTRITVGEAVKETRALIEAAAPFARVANLLDALPPGHAALYTTPLRDVLPGAWPTVGDVRRLRDELVRLGWKP